MKIFKEDKIRFWNKVNICGDDACWCYTKDTHNRYGKFWFNNKTWSAHRIAYLFHFGIDPGKLFVCHKCDNSRCCNPKHLFLGTAKDNSMDRDKKGRTGRCQGEDNGQAVLTEEKVKKIKRVLCLGFKGCEVAKQFNVSRQQISKIKLNQRWAHINAQ